MTSRPHASVPCRTPCRTDLPYTDVQTCRTDPCTPAVHRPYRPAVQTQTDLPYTAVQTQTDLPYTAVHRRTDPWYTLLYTCCTPLVHRWYTVDYDPFDVNLPYTVRKPRPISPNPAVHRPAVPPPYTVVDHRQTGTFTLV